MHEGKAILLVDDEAIILMALKAELRDALGSGYRYETALSAEDALELIKELDAEGFRVVVVISDWLMPGMKGDEFLARVHRQDPGIALIMLTGQADEAAIARVREEAKILACVRKPWRSSELISLIRSAVAPRG